MVEVVELLALELEEELVGRLRDLWLWVELCEGIGMGEEGRRRRGRNVIVYDGSYV